MKNNSSKPKNYSLFETYTDSQFGKLHGISRERSRQLRAIHAPETSTKLISDNILKNKRQLTQKMIYDKLLSYIKNNPFSVNIAEFLRINNLQKYKSIYLLDREKIKQFANDHGIVIIFAIDNKEYVHGAKCFKHCKCAIGKLANSIKQHNFKLGVKIPTSFTDYLANEYIKFYKEDKSVGHKDFYADIDEEIRGYLNLTKKKFNKRT